MTRPTRGCVGATDLVGKRWVAGIVGRGEFLHAVAARADAARLRRWRHARLPSHLRANGTCIFTGNLLNRRRTLLVDRIIVEFPLRRSRLPELFGEIVRVLRIPSAAAGMPCCPAARDVRASVLTPG